MSASFTYSIGIIVTLKIDWNWGRGTSVNKAGLAFHGFLSANTNSHFSYSGSGSDGGYNTYTEVSVTCDITPTLR